MLAEASECCKIPRITFSTSRTTQTTSCRGRSYSLQMHSTRITATLQNVLIIYVTVIMSNSHFAHSRSTIEHFSVAAPPSRSHFADSLPNLTLESTRQKAAIETNSIQRNIAESPQTGDRSRALKRVFLSNRTITCNDGSQAGFYLRKNPSSKKWIVFLEGGWHCYDTKSCRARWLKLRHLMTSAAWPETRTVGGILSALPEENPYWHKANHVLVPYCSSDSWSGTRVNSGSCENNCRFMGSLILRQVIADLIPLGLGRVANAELLLVGSSAGGLGVMLNLDRIKDYLHLERNIKVTVRGVSDSGWFLDREPYTPAAVASSDAVRQGWKLWGGLLPEQCVKHHAAEPWRCYFGYRLYPTLKSPLFVFQWLFDEAQMRADNVGAPVTPQQWNYIHEMGGALRSSLDNVTAVFAPSCIGHAVLSKRDWVNIKIDDISLPSALRCWEHSTRPRRKRHNKLRRSTEATVEGQKQRKNSQRHERHRAANKEHNSERKLRLSKEQRDERKRRRHENRLRRRERNQRTHRNRKTNERNQNIAGIEYMAPQKGKKQERRREQRKNNRNRNNHSSTTQHLEDKMIRHKEQLPETNVPADLSQAESQYHKKQPAGVQSKKLPNKSGHRRSTRMSNVPEKCELRLLERCSWPQCNHSCPSLTNPLTGEEMRFLELLTSFGLDIEAVATALGVDMHTLNNMDRTELVNLLTQQAS